MNDPSSSPRATLKDIANALGISCSAVSLALRDNPRIRLETRKRVQEMARKMNYHPNTAATALAHFKHTSAVKPVRAALAWLNFWPEPERLRKYLEFDCYWLGAEAAATKFGYHLEEIRCADMKPSRIEEILVARGIDGVIIPPQPQPERQMLIDFHFDRFSLVRLGRRMEEPRLHFVTSAQAANTIMTFEKMRERGYERIGFIGDSTQTRMFGAGYFWAQAVLPKDLRLPALLFEATDLTDKQKRIETWLKRTRPDAILADIAGLPDHLKRAGIRVPEDIGLAATSILDCGVDAGIDQNSLEIGRAAVLVLISLIQDNARGIPPIRREILVQGNWVDGDSFPWRTTTPASRQSKLAAV